LSALRPYQVSFPKVCRYDDVAIVVYGSPVRWDISRAAAALGILPEGVSVDVGEITTQYPNYRIA
jgi:predicted amidohydrolase